MQFSEFMQQLPDMWGDNGFWDFSGPRKAVLIDEETGSYWTKDKRELYVQSICLPNNGEAVVVSAKIAQFRANNQSNGALQAEVRRMKRELPTCHFDTGPGTHPNSGFITDVYVSQVTVIRPASASAIEGRIGSLQSCIKQTETYLRTIPDQYEKKGFDACLLMKEPNLAFTRACAVAAASKTTTPLVEAIIHLHRPANHKQLMDYATSLAQASGEARTGFWSFLDQSPALDTSLLSTGDTISFWTPHNIQLAVTRMSGKREVFFVAANACQASIVGISRDAMDRFFKRLTELAAPVEIQFDNAGNVILAHAVLATELTEERIAASSSRFWQTVIKVRNTFLKYERATAGAPAQFSLPGKSEYPLPRWYVDGTREMKLKIETTYATAIAAEMGPSIRIAPPREVAVATQMAGSDQDWE